MTSLRNRVATGVAALAVAVGGYVALDGTDATKTDSAAAAAGPAAANLRTYIAKTTSLDINLTVERVDADRLRIRGKNAAGTTAVTIVVSEAAARTLVDSLEAQLVEAPPVDTDGDGVADATDQCPLQIGPAPSGCPAPPSGGFGAWKWDAAGATVDSGYPTSSVAAAQVPSPSFANGDYGVATAYAKDGDPTYGIPSNNGTKTFRIPLSSRPTAGSDHHLTVIDGGKALDLYDAVYNSTTQRISSAQAAVIYDWPGAINIPTGWCGNAACTPQLAGLVTPEALKTAIDANTALPFTLQFSQPRIPAGGARWPGTHNVATCAAGLVCATHEGTWVRLKQSVDCGAIAVPYQRVICLTFKKHGGVNRDNGGSFGVYGENLINQPGRSWAIAGVSGAYPSLTGVPWAGNLEVLLPPGP